MLEEGPHAAGSAEWQEEHLGILTSRHIGSLITNTWKQSGHETRRKLANRLLAEWATGEEYDDFGGTAAMQRGEDLEGESMVYWKAMRDESEVRAPGIIYAEGTQFLAGSTPDWVVGPQGEEVGCVEVKCPFAPQHIANLLYVDDGIVPPEYMRQCQWHLWVTGLEWCDFFSYHDRIGAQAIMRVEPLDEAFNAFENFVPPFIKLLRDKREQLRRLGLVRT